MPKKEKKKLKIRLNKTRAAFGQTKFVPAEFDSEKIEREKKMFMWVGVSCVMAVFFIIWIFNLKYQFTLNANNGGQGGFNWEQTKIELDRTMAQVKSGIAEIKQTQANAQNTLPKDSALTDEQINMLKGKILNEVSSSTTASSTKK